MDYAVEIENLSKIYKTNDSQNHSTFAVQNVSLMIPRGCIFGLLGKNGAGKSTIINIMAGLVIKTSGRVRIYGYDQDDQSRQSRAAIGVMPQELNMDPFLTPYSSLEVQAGLYGVPKAKRRTKDILRMVGLSDKANAYSRTLSGGMQRRLLLGKAMVHNPPVLVLDEPTAGVDIGMRQMLWDNVRELNKQGVTIILTTHYLEEAESVCDYIAIMNEGQIIAQERTEPLIGHIESKSLVITLENKPSQDILLPADIDMRERDDGKLCFTYKRNKIKVQTILDAVRNAGAVIADVETEEPDLEDVFLTLTSGKSNEHKGVDT